jgi:hypothetical protein
MSLFTDLAKIRRAKRRAARSIPVQCLRKDGTWGATVLHESFGTETPEEVVERLTRLNPGRTFRLAN